MDARRQTLVVPDATAMAEAAAARIARRIETGNDRIAICLTGGSTPKHLYQFLATPTWRARIPWPRVHWFMGDDRFVPQHDARSNTGMARHAFLDTCAAPGTVHAMPTDLASPDDAARAYQVELQTFYGATQLDPARPLFDLVLMGIGPDGHTASLFPGDPAIDERNRWVVGIAKAGVAPFVPRVTLTPPALESCREMLFLVSGADKRDVVARALREPSLPAARIQSHHETLWMLDRDAAGDCS